MGWRLVVNVLKKCPDIPYREFRILIAIALDARDSTCEGMPGMALLAEHGQCAERTARRVLLRLRQRGLIELAHPAARGRRAVYRLRPMPGSPGAAGLAQPVDNSTERGTQPMAHDDPANVGHPGGQRGPIPLATTWASISGPPLVNLVKPPTCHPVKDPLIVAEEEGSRFSTGQDQKSDRRPFGSTAPTGVG
jgi:hypothetical protein